MLILGDNKTKTMPKYYIIFGVMLSTKKLVIFGFCGKVAKN